MLLIQFCKCSIVFHRSACRIINLTIIEVNQCTELITGIGHGSIIMVSNLIFCIRKQSFIICDRTIISCSAAGTAAISIISHNIQQICRVIEIINFITDFIRLALYKSNPCLFISLVSSNIFIQRTDFFKVILVHLTAGSITEHKVQVIQVTICLHAVTIHTLDIDIHITRIYIIPLAVKFYCIPVMSFAKWGVLTEHGNILRIKDNLYIVSNCSRILAPFVIAILIFYRISIAVQFIVQLLIGFPILSCINISCTIFQINLRMCTLQQICINIGITETYSFVTYKNTNLVGSPHTDDSSSCGSSLLLSAAAFFLHIYHESFCLLSSNRFCLFFPICIFQCIIGSIVYLLFNHIIHTVISICIKRILCRFRLYHFFHDRVHGKLTIISQPVIQCHICLHLCHIIFQNRQSLISSCNYFIFIFRNCKLSTQIIQLNDTGKSSIISFFFRNACDIQK